MSKTIRKEYAEAKKPSMFRAKKSRHETKKELAMLTRK